MTKVHGKRYAYKFDFHGLMAACQAQAQGNSGGDPTMTYTKYHHHQSELGAALYPAHHHSPGKLSSILPPPPPGVVPPASPFPAPPYCWTSAAANAASAASLSSIYSVAANSMHHPPGVARYPYPNSTPNWNGVDDLFLIYLGINKNWYAWTQALLTVSFVTAVGQKHWKNPEEHSSLPKNYLFCDLPLGHCTGFRCCTGKSGATAKEFYFF